MISVGFMSMEELLVKLKTWKSEIKKMGLQVNMGKTTIMVSGLDWDLTARPIDRRTVKGVKVGEERLEAVSEIHHHSPFLVNGGRMYSTSVRSVMLQRHRP